MSPIIRQCINILVDEAMNTDSRNDFLAQSLIYGHDGIPFSEMSEDDLIQEVYNQCSYKFSEDELDAFSEDNEDLKKWIMANHAIDWVGKLTNSFEVQYPKKPKKKGR
jgi:hypothetical protein